MNIEINLLTFIYSKHTWIGFPKCNKIKMWFCVETSIPNSNDNALNRRKTTKSKSKIQHIGFGQTTTLKHKMEW